MRSWVLRGRCVRTVVGVTLTSLSLISGLAIASHPTAAETISVQGDKSESQSNVAAAVVVELNRLRTNPTAYADWLENMSQYYDGSVLALPGEDPIRTREGVAGLQEAIAVLRAMKPLPPTTLSPGMSQAAQDHVTDTGNQGVVGSVGTDGSSPGDRAKRYGTFKGGLVELLSYGKKTASGVVLQLLINDGDPNRGLRGELLNPKARFMGVACGSHVSRGGMCVLELSAEYTEQPGALTASKVQSVTTRESQTQPSRQAVKPSPKPVALTQPVAESTQTAIAPPQSSPKPQEVAKATPAAAFTTPDSPQRYLSLEEREIFEETNRVRANPTAYAKELENLRQYFDGKLLKLPGQAPLETEEGISVVEEAIQVLRATKPMPILSFSKGMSVGAKDHVNDLGPTGATGHYGTDGSKPDKRISRYGTWKGLTGENISYSPMSNAKWHVIQLLIDDGVKDRGHRKAILKPDYRITGVACGSHAVYTTMCVMEYATEYQEGL